MDRVNEEDCMLPPGTERIETTRGTEIVLAPAPSNDPNQPLVNISLLLPSAYLSLTRSELVYQKENDSHHPPLFVLYLCLRRFDLCDCCLGTH
jgi:hypothetical protein